MKIGSGSELTHMQRGNLLVWRVNLLWNSGMEDQPLWVSAVIVPLVLWGLFWKAAALWHAARNSDRVWFAVFFVFSTAGLLEIIYLARSGKLKPRKLFK